MINKILSKFGLKISKIASATNDMISLDVEFLNQYKITQPYTMTSKERCFALYKAVKHVQAAKISGDLVECGVWRGGNTMLMANILTDSNSTDRSIYLYDTYEGMSEPSPADKKTGSNEPARSKWSVAEKESHNEWCYASLEEVQENMNQTAYPQEKLHFIKGKVEETLQQKKPNQIAILRLDTDWYESTKAELETLFPLLASGGILIIDDYGSWEGARKAVDEYFAPGEILLHRIDASGVIGIKN
jgi:hypothetical protein